MGNWVPALLTAVAANDRAPEFRARGCGRPARVRRCRLPRRLRLPEQPDGRLRRRARTRADARSPSRPRRLRQSMPERSGVLARRPQLITYPDSLTSNLGGLAELLGGPLAGLFHGVHILPPFPSSGDRGFAPLTYREIDPRFGTWEDIARIAEHHDVLLDLMINHLSRQSREFRDFERTGRRSPYADLFITLDKIWPT